MLKSYSASVSIANFRNKLCLINAEPQQFIHSFLEIWGNLIITVNYFRVSFNIKERRRYVFRGAPSLVHQKQQAGSHQVHEGQFL
jgi:hypothetical protein